jgi:hypothetical protein
MMLFLIETTSDLHFFSKNMNHIIATYLCSLWHLASLSVSLSCVVFLSTSLDILLVLHIYSQTDGCRHPLICRLRC